MSALGQLALMMKQKLATYLMTLFLLAFLIPFPLQAEAVCNLYVAIYGNDNNPGTLVAPWRTIQKAANTATAGQTVCVRGGVYQEIVTFNISGSAAAGFITFKNYPHETAILDGTNLPVPAGLAPMINITNRAYITIQGFEIRNYKSSFQNHAPIGILVSGYGDHIQLRNNLIHNIETNYPGTVGGDAHGIAIYGTVQPNAKPNAITNVVISGNQLYNLKTGSSESLVVNGNVDGFQITNNIVHDNNNIGIDIIGFENTNNFPLFPDYDQARNGLVNGNLVYNIDSYGNPAYGTERSAAGIYVDGGRDTIIERNIIHHANVGVELASEHHGRTTSNVTLRNNFIYSNTQVGIGFGGADKGENGGTVGCVIVNNTLYNNVTHTKPTPGGDWGAELYIQSNANKNFVENNIIFANVSRLFVANWDPVTSGSNVVDHNLYFALGGGSSNGSWIWRTVEYPTFDAYSKASGNDGHSLVDQDPKLVSIKTPNLHIQTTSPAIDRGLYLPEAGSLDIDLQARIQGAGIDLGADEVR